MKFVQFEQVNNQIAENQEEYQTLPAYVSTQQGTVTACFELDEDEKKQLQETGRLYLTILNQGQPLQPIGSSLINPFKDNNETKEVDEVN